MVIGDRVRVGIGSIQIANDNVPVYKLDTDQFGNVVYDFNKTVRPKAVGGVKGGSLGTMKNGPVKAAKQFVHGLGEGTVGMGNDYVLLYEVTFEYYQQSAWVLSDHVHII